MQRTAVVALLGLVACTSPTTVTVELASDLPDFIAYRDGTSAWKTPQPSTGGTYAAHHFELEVTGDYEVVAVTLDQNSGNASSMEVHATSGDPTHWYLDGGGAFDADVVVIEPSYPSTLNFCWPPGLPQNTSGTVVASGTMAQPGQISIGGICTSWSKPSWDYQLWVPPGLHDVIATDPMGTASPRVAITRGVTIGAATALPAIDLAANGQPLDSTTITVVNTGTESNDAIPITSQLVILTATEGATLTSGTDTVASRSHVVPIVPASLLETSDSQVLTISVTDYSTAHRWASTRHPTETPVFEFLSSPMSSVTTDTGVDTVTWSEPLSTRIEAVDVHTWLMNASSNVISQTVTATTAWLDAHHETSLAFDRDVPNYDPSWGVDVSKAHTTQFTVRGNEGHIGYATTRSRNN